MLFDMAAMERKRFEEESAMEVYQIDVRNSPPQPQRTSHSQTPLTSLGQALRAATRGSIPIHARHT
jgi:hypothetical protein